MKIGLKSHRTTLEQDLKAMEKKNTTAKKHQYSKRKKGGAGIVLPFLLFMNGASIGYFTENLYLMPVLGAIFGCLPFYIGKGKRLKKERETLSQILRTITGVYLQEGNLIESIQKTEYQMQGKIKIAFRDFILNMQTDFANAVLELKEQYNMLFFKEWCDALILCHYDSSMNPLLHAILHKEAEKEIAKSVYREKNRRLRLYSYIIAVIVMGAIVVAYLLNDNSRYFLISVHGQRITALYVGVIAILLYQLKGDGIKTWED